LNIKHYKLAAVVAFLALSSSFSMAQETRPARPTEAQMKAIHDCAAAKGVELPAPPAGGPKGGPAAEAKGERPSGPPPEGGQPPKDGGPKEGGEHKGPHGPKLTEAQRVLVDACFAEQGLTPPKAPPKK